MVVAQLAERPRLFPTPYGPTSNPVIGKFYSAFVYFKLLKNVNKNKNKKLNEWPNSKSFWPIVDVACYVRFSSYQTWSQSVWPDDILKSSPIYPKSSCSSFYLRIDIFKIAQKVNKYL